MPKENNGAEKKKLGFFVDDNGDLSSGRLIKIGSFVISVIISFLGIILKSEYQLILGLVGIFMGVATSAEIVQKVTKS